MASLPIPALVCWGRSTGRRIERGAAKRRLEESILTVERESSFWGRVAPPALLMHLHRWLISSKLWFLRK
jgi:hypothetical protein